MAYVVGLDAGGTKTVAVVLDETRRERGRATGGPGNYHSAGAEGALRAIRQAVSEALERAGLAPEQVDAACFAMSGVDRAADRAVARSFAGAVLPAASAIVCNDAVAALASGTGRAQGIVVIAGTGSIVYGVAPGGAVARAGGWGFRLGDEGSGFWIAERSLRAIARAHDGCAPPTAMTARYLERLQLSDARDLIGWAYGERWTRDGTAALAPLTLDAAQAGDAAALGIVDAGAGMLADAVRVVAHKLGLQGTPFDVVLCGSLFRSALYEYALRRALGERTAGARPLLPRADAATGAAWLALDLLNGEPMAWLTSD